MAVATEVLDDILRTGFGFKSLLWVFSGRRGIHCWVCDEHARSMNNELRASITEYINIGVGNEQSGKLRVSQPLHPMLQKSLKRLLAKFEEIVIEEQKLLESETHQRRFLQILDDPNIKKSILHAWKSKPNSSSEEKWEIFKQCIPVKDKDNQSKKSKDHLTLIAQIPDIQSLIFTYLYPRLDSNVSKAINHLLKSPFCVHPKTGKICVPFDPRQVSKFDVNDVATLNLAITDFSKLSDGQSIAESMAKPMEVFRKFLGTLQTSATDKENLPQNSSKTNSGIDF